MSNNQLSHMVNIVQLNLVIHLLLNIPNRFYLMNIVRNLNRSRNIDCFECLIE